MKVGILWILVVELVGIGVDSKNKPIFRVNRKNRTMEQLKDILSIDKILENRFSNLVFI